jgi:uncharacterized protein
VSRALDAPEHPLQGPAHTREQEEEPMGDQVVHFEIAGADGDALAAFYENLFGWRSEPVAGSGGTYRLLDTGGDGPTGGIGSWPQVPPYVAFYVGVDDLDAGVEKARTLGAEVVMAPREVTPGRRAAMIRDFEGNMVGLIEPQAAAT